MSIWVCFCLQCGLNSASSSQYIKFTLLLFCIVSVFYFDFNFYAPRWNWSNLPHTCNKGCHATNVKSLENYTTGHFMYCLVIPVFFSQLDIYWTDLAENVIQHSRMATQNWEIVSFTRQRLCFIAWRNLLGAWCIEDAFTLPRMQKPFGDP